MSNIRVSALKIEQGPGRALFSFAIRGKEIQSIASISRVKRHENELVGYQRPEVTNHIKEITRYLESENPMIPNALVIAFKKSVTFVPSENNSNFGELIIPIVESDEEKPGLIVDGQQRAAALREANIDSFQMPVSAFITDDAQEQREQFILVNSTKPLPKGLIYELLPYTETKLSAALQKRRFPATILDELNQRPSSPFYQIIKTATNPTGLIKDNSVLKLIEASITEGALYNFRDASTGEGDIEKMIEVLCNFWSAVRDVFPEAWGVNPKNSRLMHGAGMSAFGHLMDAIFDRYFTDEHTDVVTYGQFKQDLEKMQPFCKWTNGYWDFGSDDKVKWNELQNITRDIQKLSNHLLRKYRIEVWN
jgi:DNA sulfur modification protein DndB